MKQGNVRNGSLRSVSNNAGVGAFQKTSFLPVKRLFWWMRSLHDHSRIPVEDWYSMALAFLKWALSSKRRT